MANTWFQFKQFTIHQDKTAMKVGTDGVLLGAWCSAPEGAKHAIDAGTGTGLIALMLAQRYPQLIIDGLEIDPDAAGQATENFNNSAWSSRLKCHKLNFMDFQPPSDEGFDFVVCNPPFFSRSLRSGNIRRDIARHDDRLAIQDFLLKSCGLLSEQGKISLVIPASRMEEVSDYASENNLFLARKANVHPVPGKKPVRILLEFTKRKTEFQEESFSIEENGRHQYSLRYRELTDDFYL